VRGEEDGGQRERIFRLVIEGESGIGLRREAQVPLLEKAVRAREIEIGDAGFDGEVYVRGEPEILRAVLDDETRLSVRDLLRHGVSTARGRVLAPALVTVRDGNVVCETGFADADLRAELGSVLERLLGLARRLRPPADAVARLVENTAREPDWRVRVANLRFLMRTYPQHPGTRQALERALRDTQEDVQLEAALGLGGDQGRALLLEIASREWSGDTVAARAVAALQRDLPLERAQAILGHALRTRRVETARACIDALGSSGEAGVADLLARVLHVETGALAAAAARALGSAGTAASIAVLKEAAEHEPGLSRAAREAIASIRARIDATPGQLTLTHEGGDAGQVSLAGDGTAGAVSVADPTSSPRSPAATSPGPPRSRRAR
jgi:HEAT repeat protein